MNEVNPDMYSPADRPSSIRAAPAKNLIWSTIGGISSEAVSASGFPVFWDSALTNSSARDSIASAILSRARLRSAGVVSRHPSKAAAAEDTAASTSVSPDTGAVANTSPVLGLISSERLSKDKSVHWPPMKFCRSSATTPPFCSDVLLLPSRGAFLARPWRAVVGEQVQERARGQRLGAQHPGT